MILSQEIEANAVAALGEGNLLADRDALGRAGVAQSKMQPVLLFVLNSLCSQRSIPVGKLAAPP